MMPYCSRPEKCFVPFLNEVLKRDIKINLHTPNALNARFITGELAGAYGAGRL